MSVLFALLAPAKAGIIKHERKAGGHVQFAVNKDHTLTPMLPMSLRADQEEGAVPDGPLTCDVASREHEISEDGSPRTASETVLHCNGGRTFAVKQLLFSSSEGVRR